MAWWMVAAAGLQIAGSIKSSRARRKAAEANKRYYQQQLELQQMATRRELDIFNRESDLFLGSQVSSFAKAGVDMSGTIMMKMAGDRAAVQRERNAILMGAKTKMRLTELRMEAAENEARDSERAVPWQIASTLLNTYGGYETLNKQKQIADTQEQILQMRQDAWDQTERMGGG